MSNLEKDLNPNTFIGISLPLSHGSKGFFGQTKTTLQQARHNIKNLLLTMKGERLGNPTFGSDLMRVVFEQDDNLIEDKIEEAIREAMDNWLPFITLAEIKTERDHNALSNRVIVKLKFTMNMDQNVQSVTLNLGPDAPFSEYEVSDVDTGEYVTDYT
tara:strand:- start:161 stop:634 length:474 start_codon:yes stop_codon:yes gene_type:complete